MMKFNIRRWICGFLACACAAGASLAPGAQISLNASLAKAEAVETPAAPAPQPEAPAPSQTDAAPAAPKQANAQGGAAEIPEIPSEAAAPTASEANAPANPEALSEAAVPPSPEANAPANPETPSETAASASPEANAPANPEVSSETAAPPSPEANALANPKTPSETAAPASTEANAPVNPETPSETAVPPSPEASAPTNLEAPSGTAVPPSPEVSASANPEAPSETAAPPSPEASAPTSPEPSPEAAPSASPEASPSVEPSPSPAPIPETIALPVSGLYIGYKETVRGALNPIFPPDANCVYRYSTSNAKVVRVDPATGAIYGAKVGSAYITVSVENGPSASCKVVVRKAPSKVTLKIARRYMGVGEALELSAGFNSKAYSYNLQFASSNEAVVRIEGRKAVAVGPGSATLYARTYNKKTAKLKVAVYSAPTTLTFDSTAPVLGVGQSYRFTVHPEKGAFSLVSFSCDGAAEINADGWFTASAPGTATVRATAYNGVTAQQSVTIAPAPTAIQLSADGVVLCVGESLSDPVTVTQDNGAEGGLRFKSSNKKIVSVDSSGRITARRKGSAIITMATYNGVTARYKVRVLNAPTKLKLSGPTRLGLGERFTPVLSAKNKGAGTGAYVLASSNPDVLRVEPDGRQVTAAGVGYATLYARTYNKKTAKLNVAVCSAPEWVDIAQDSVVIGVGQRVALRATLSEGAAGTFQFSGESAFASLTQGGVLTGLAPGAFEVRAETYNGKSDSCAVTVLPAPTSITLAETGLAMGVKERRGSALHVSVNEGSAGSFIFKSSNKRCVRVDAHTGELIAVKAGTAYVYAVAYNGLKSNPCKVVVRKAPSKIAIAVPSPVFGVGQTQNVQVALNKGASGGWSLVSSDPNVVAVEGNTTLRAVAPGTATITAVTFNNKRRSVNLSVLPAPTSVAADVAKVSVIAQLSQPIGFHVNEGSYTSFRYESSDPSVVSVSESGTITGLRAGSAVITASTHNGLQAQAAVRVLPAPEALVAELSSIQIGVGESRAIRFTTVPEDAQGLYTYRSSNPAVANVSQDGVIYGMRRGTAIVAVRAHSGAELRLIVEVVGYGKLNPAYAVAHRGASGYLPGNTLEAFTYAAELGAKAIELDVRRTSDGQLIVFHDSSIPLNKRKSAAISSLTLEQVQALRPNVPTLDAALDCIAKTGMDVIIELKEANIEQDVLVGVDRSGMRGRAQYASFSLDVIDKVKRMDPEARTVYLIRSKNKLKSALKDVHTANYDAVSISHALITENVVRDWHFNGKTVIAWTLNKLSEIQKMVQAGVDGIATDYPDRV